MSKINDELLNTNIARTDQGNTFTGDQVIKAISATALTLDGNNTGYTDLDFNVNGTYKGCIRTLSDKSLVHRHDGNNYPIITSEKIQVIFVNKSFTSSTSFSYTGASFSVPENCIYSVTAHAVYNNSHPEVISINSSSTNSNTAEVVVENSTGNGGHLSATFSGYAGSGEGSSYYVWAKHSGATSNTILIRGWYIKTA